MHPFKAPYKFEEPALNNSIITKVLLYAGLIVEAVIWTVMPKSMPGQGAKAAVTNSRKLRLPSLLLYKSMLLF